MHSGIPRYQRVIRIFFLKLLSPCQVQIDVPQLNKSLNTGYRRHLDLAENVAWRFCLKSRHHSFIIILFFTIVLEKLSSKSSSSFAQNYKPFPFSCNLKIFKLKANDNPKQIFVSLSILFMCDSSVLRFVSLLTRKGLSLLCLDRTRWA